MTHVPVTRADASRSRMIQATRDWSDLEVVAEAVTAASSTERTVYVERLGNLYRWSLATRGGGYPLLRIVARFLGVDHYRIYVGFRTLPDGTAIVCEDPAAFDEPDSWALLHLDGCVTEASAASRIKLVLGGSHR